MEKKYKIPATDLKKFFIVFFNGQKVKNQIDLLFGEYKMANAAILPEDFGKIWKSLLDISRYQYCAEIIENL